MNKQGQTKLLAAIAVLAMVVCAFAVVMPSETDAATGITQDSNVTYGTEPVEVTAATFASASTTNSNFDVTIEEGFTTIKLKTAQTWNLTDDVTISNGTLDLNGNNLKITGEGSLTITYNDPTALGAALMSNNTTAANVCIDGTEVTFVGSGEREGGAWTVDAMNIAQFVVMNGATLNVEKNDSSAVGTLWHTDQGSAGDLPKVSGNNNVLFVIGSKVNFTNNDPASAGVQVCAIVASENSEITSKLNGGSVAAYIKLTDSNFNGDTVNIYGADLDGTSKITATTIGNYGITGGTSAFEGFTLGTITMSGSSSIQATTISNGFSNFVSGTNTITFIGDAGTTGAKVAGMLTAPFANTSNTANYAFNNIDVSGITVSGEGTINVTKTNTTGDVSGTVEAETGGNVDATEISKLFTNGATVVNITGGNITGNISGITGELALDSDVSMGTDAEFILSEGGSVSKNFTSDSFKVTYGEGSATFDGFSGNAEISTGSITVIGADIIDGVITSSSEVKIYGTVSGELTININGSGSLKISDAEGKGQNLVVEDGATLTINGNNWDISEGITGSAVLDIRGTLATNGMKITAGSDSKIITYPSTNLSNVTLTGNVEYETENIAYEFKGMLDQDIIISTEQSLTGDLWIPEGVSLTIASGGVLNMAGYGIYVQGTLDVQANGAIKSIPSVNAESVFKGQILLHKDGTITNEGVIGSGSEVTVSADINNKQNEAAYGGLFANTDLRVTYNGVGSVSMQNVTGVTFSVKTDGDNRALTISGEVYSYGVSSPYTMSANTVNVEDTLTVGEGVTFTAKGAVSIRSGATFNIEGTVVSNGNVVMKNGSTVNVEGTVTGKIVAETGNFVTAQKYQGVTKTDITFDNVTDVVLTVGQTTYTKNNTSYTNQILYISGNISIFDAEVKDTGIFTIDNATNNGLSNIAEDAKVVLDEGVTFNMGGTTVLGEVSYPDDTSTSAKDFVGTQYTIKGATASDDDVIYITTFANAYAQIANADKNTISVYGKLIIDFNVDLAEKQTIDIRNATEVIIDADATVEVQRNGAIINGSVSDVQGVLTVYNGGNVKQPQSYAVYKKTTEYVQYSGLVPAINNAQPGDVIDVKNNAEVKDDLTIPAGVTVNNEAVLTFREDLTVAETAVLNNEGTIYMAGNKSTVTVYGTFDNMEGSTFGFYNLDGETPVVVTENAQGDNRAVYSTGTMIVGDVTSIENFVNAAAYGDEDSNIVLTSVAKAVSAVESQDSGDNYVYILGTINQTEDISLADGTAVIVLSNAKATLGTINLASGASVYSYGQLTATVTGQTGVEGSEITSTIDLSKAAVTISLFSYTSNANVTTDYMGMYGAVAGNITVSAGKVNVFNGSGDQGAVVKFTVNGTTLTVAEGATLAVEKVGDYNATLVAGEGEKADTASVIVNGTILFDDGELEAYDNKQIITVNGTMNVADETDVTVDGTLEIVGTLAISTTEDKAGSVTVSDGAEVVVGDKPTELGASGSGAITGAIESDNGILKAYNGADLSGAMIDVVSGESEANYTAFYINGELYMTVYSVDAAQVKNVVGNEDFEIVGYVTERTGANAIDIGELEYWYTDAEMSQKATDVTDLGNPEALYFKAPAAEVTITVSVGSGISIYIDDVRITENTVDLAVGTHTVSATVNPGFTGDVQITFNGQAATNGQFTITPEMASNAYDGPKAISATGNITQDSTVVVNGGSSDDGMGLTDILLIILVILIVVMAIIVALRLMRS